MKIHVVLTGRGYDAAESLPNELTLSADADLAEALTALRSHYSEESGLPPSCLVAVSGRHVGTVAQHQPISLREGDELTLIAPVAGG